VLKPLLLLSSVILLAAAAPSLGRMLQDAKPASEAHNPVKPTADSQAKAKKMYGYDCAMCHGDNGNGKTDLATSMSLTLTDLSDPKTLTGKSDQDIFDLIRKGKDKMPPEEAARAKDDDVWNLVIYVRGLAKGGTTTASNP
jgi:mono/diheme cytochrome c family protein